MAKIYRRKDTKKVSYYAHFTVRGNRYRVKLEARNVEQAKKLATDIEYQILAGNYKVLDQGRSITLKELSDRYLEYAKTKKRSWSRDVTSLKNILNMEVDDRKLGDYPVEAIKVAHIQKYQIRRKRDLDIKQSAKGISLEDRHYATCNRELACLRHIFNMGIEWELLTKNPVVSKVVRFDKEKSRQRTLEDDEFSSILHASQGRMQQIILIALNTGMRISEILSLKWENVNIDKNKIEVKHTKNGEDRIIPMNSFLGDLFKLMPRDHAYLFVNRNCTRIGSIKTAWNNVLQRTGIEDLHFHDLRHTAASRLARAKVPESVIAMLLGHKRTTITSRYINPHWDEMVEAVEELGRICHRFVTIGRNEKNAIDANLQNYSEIKSLKSG